MPIDSTRSHVMKAQFDHAGKPGPKVFMYNDEPGVYYDAHGKEVPSVIAKQAGFDIDEMEQLKTLTSEKARLMQRYSDMVGPRPPRTVEDVRPHGHQLVRIGPDLYHIEDKNNHQVTSAPLSRYYAVIWLDDLDPHEKNAKSTDNDDEKSDIDWETLDEAPMVFQRVKAVEADDGDHEDGA